MSRCVGPCLLTLRPEARAPRNKKHAARKRREELCETFLPRSTFEGRERDLLLWLALWVLPQ